MDNDTLPLNDRLNIGDAVKSAISKGAANSLTYIQQAASGEITEDEAIEKIVDETKSAAIETLGTVCGTMCEADTVIPPIAEDSGMPVLAGQGLRNTLAANIVAGGASCAIEAAKDLVKLGMGEITAEECLERQGKNILATSEGMIGASVGGVGGMALASSLGVATESIGTTIATLAGGLSGGLIAGLAMTFAIENGVEKPYRDLMRNTENLREAAVELTHLSETVFKSQIVFGKFLEADYALEKEFQSQMKRVDEVGKRAMAIINRI